MRKAVAEKNILNCAENIRVTVYSDYRDPYRGPSINDVTHYIEGGGGLSKT